MDQFSFFFAFYGLILGLAVAELLSGFAGLVRARAVRKIDARTALLAIFTFLLLCATWIDAFKTRGVTLDFGGLWAPILVATCYYLAATVIFPTDEAEFDRLDDYFSERKWFVVAMIFGAEIFLNIQLFGIYVSEFVDRPASFWLVLLPFNLLINSLYIALLVVKGRRANIFCLAGLIIAFVAIYWSSGWLSDMADQRLGHLWSA